MSASVKRRVVITGAGLVSPLGNTLESVWDALTHKRSGVRPLRCLPTEFLPSKCGAEAWDFTGQIDDFGALEANQKKTIRKGLKVMCREIQMGVAAAQLAISHAGLREGNYNVDRTGVLYGCDYIMSVPEEFAEGVRNCLDDQHQFHFEQWAERGLPKVTPLWLLKYLPNMPASHIAIYNDFRGPNNSITLREASANLAFAEAYCTIARGSADTLVVGATGSRLTPLRAMHVSLQEELASQADDPARLCRPFDLHRSGSVLGEGAGAVVVEELETAKARGAKIWGELVGYGSSTVIDRTGVGHYRAAFENVLRQCLQTAEVAPEKVGHVHAHGLASRRCDAEEAQAIQHVFADHPVPVVAAKSYFGNLGAGSGIIELICSLQAVAANELFPLLNYETPDPECPIHAARGGEPAGDRFVSLSITPQGQASGILVSRFCEE